ncbi:MAG: helix-turn-helix domain-containing protein [Clostridiaceae bacterium]
MKEEFHMCPKYEKLATFLGKRWTGLILRVLLEGEFRFSEILDSVHGLSSRLLTERLKEMEEAGIVLREVRNEYPIKVEYTLTQKGRSLAPVIKEMQAYAEEWL